MRMGRLGSLGEIFKGRPEKGPEKEGTASGKEDLGPEPEATPELVREFREKSEARDKERGRGEPRYEVIEELVIPSKYHEGAARLTVIIAQAERQGDDWFVRSILGDKMKVPDSPDGEILTNENYTDHPPIVLGKVKCQPGTTAEEVMDVARSWVGSSTGWIPRSYVFEPGEDRDSFRRALYLVRQLA